MFCDIKGFTPFSEALAAYDVIFILNRYISIMREIIIKNGGEINNYIGDAILAIFGLKDSRQQTLRAANTALEICLLYTSPSPRDPKTSRMPSSA